MHGDDATPALARSFSPWRLGELELPHRVITGSMHTGIETLDDGGAALSAYYAERIRGGATLIITGGLAVNAEGCGADDFREARPDDPPPPNNPVAPGGT